MAAKGRARLSGAPKGKTLTFRLPEETLNRLDAAASCAKNPYAPNRSKIIARGIELALRELERKAKK